MKTMLVHVLTLGVTTAALGCGSYATLSDFREFAALNCSRSAATALNQLTHDAVATDKAKAESAIRSLRARGPEGLRALLENNGVVQVSGEHSKTATITSLGL